MAEVDKTGQTGAGRSKPRDRHGVDLVPRQDYTLGQFLCAWPGQADNGEPYNTPLPNIAAFDQLEANGYTPQQVERLVDWIEPQTTIDWLMRVHGPAGTKRVLRGIAKAAVSMNVSMKKRVLHTAEACGFLD